MRTGSGLPIDGITEFDEADASARSDENWLGVLKHEVSRDAYISSFNILSADL